MAQFARPDSDVTVTSFTGGFVDIDEATASDSDFAYGANNTAAELEVGLTNPADPNSSTGHLFRYRIAKTNAGTVDGTGNAVTVTARLMQGTTQVATDTAKTADGTWTQYEYTLTGAEADAITDYTNLRLEFLTSASGGSPANRRGGAVSWAELEVPDAVIARTAADSVTLSETLARTGTFLRTLADTVTSSETVARTLTLLRTLADTRTITETAEGIKVLVRSLADTLATSETVARAGTFLRTLADSVSLSETVAGSKLVVRSLADSLATSEAVTRAVTLARTLADALALTESVARTITSGAVAAMRGPIARAISHVPRGRGGSHTPRT